MEALLSSFLGSLLQTHTAPSSFLSPHPISIPQRSSFFPHSPPSFPARGSAVIGWRELLSVERAQAVTILVAGEWNGIKLLNWAIEFYFHLVSVSVSSGSKYRSGTCDANETCPSFHCFKSTYVISSLHQQELAIPYHLELILQSSFLLPCQFRPFPVVLGGQVHVLETGSTCHPNENTAQNPRKTHWVWATRFSQYPVDPVHNAVRDVTNP